MKKYWGCQRCEKIVSKGYERNPAGEVICSDCLEEEKKLWGDDWKKK